MRRLRKGSHIEIGESQISLVLTLSQYLAECDHVILMKDGQIAEHGTHSQLMGRDRDYAALVNSVQQEVMPTTERMSSSSLITDLLPFIVMH
jgi:ABC-type cobalamin/Fe3+-siderophores transport system ATPase subunit